MNEKMLKLYEVAEIYDERNKENNYVEITYTTDNKKIQIYIREKGTFTIKQIFEMYLNQEGILNIDDIIEKIEKRIK